MYILGMESSCDETSAAVVEMRDGVRRICSNIVASQFEVHRLYGGVVPEIASRAHIEAVTGITHEALDTAGVTLADIGAVAGVRRRFYTAPAEDAYTMVWVADGGRTS